MEKSKYEDLNLNDLSFILTDEGLYLDLLLTLKDKIGEEYGQEFLEVLEFLYPDFMEPLVNAAKSNIMEIICAMIDQGLDDAGVIYETTEDQHLTSEQHEENRKKKMLKRLDDLEETKDANL
jgi:hypothetical protein